MSSIRTFIAIEIGPSVKRRTADAIDRLRVSGGPVKWVVPENIHLTLKFLGNVETDQICPTCLAVESVVEQFAPFALKCGNIGAFPTVEQPKVVWMGCGEGTDLLVDLQQAIDAKLAELGFPPEPRVYKPHITLGRIRRGDASLTQLSQLIDANHDFDGGSFDINEVLVISSSLQRKGPEYTPLSRAALG